MPEQILAPQDQIDESVKLSQPTVLNAKFRDLQNKEDYVYSAIIATNLTIVKKAKESAVASMRESLADMTKTVPKISDTVYQEKTVSELRTAQAVKRKEITETGLRKRINSTAKEFEKTGVISIEVPFGAETVHKQVAAKLLLTEADLAAAMIAQGRVEKDNINKQLGYVAPANPHLVEW